jgi:hypothetical protein
MVQWRTQKRSTFVVDPASRMSNRVALLPAAAINTARG